MPGELTAAADPGQLIPGDPDALDELAGTLGRFARGLGDGADRLRRIKAGSWKGHGGNAFRGIIDEQPAKFGTASDAFGQAELAISRYAGVLRDAQRSAVLAVGQYGAGEQASTAWDRKGKDPGAADRAAAHRTLHDARGRVELAALRAGKALQAATHDAPKKPSILHCVASGIESLIDGRDGRQLIEIGKGMAEGAKDMATGLWTLTGAVLTDRSKFARAWTGLGKTMITEQGRQEFARSFVDWEEWSKDPARAFGHSAVSVASMFVGGEGVAAKLGDVSKAAELAKIVDAGKMSAEMRAVLTATESSPARLDGYPAWKGLTDHANWAQKKYGALFSKGGPFKNRTIDEVAGDIRSGLISWTKLPIDIIRRGSNTLILNTRSSHALIEAGIPRSQWIVRDVTDDPEFEARLAEQLRRNKLQGTGISSVRAGKLKQTEEMRPPGWPYNLAPERKLPDARSLGTVGPIANYVGMTH